MNGSRDPPRLGVGKTSAALIVLLAAILVSLSFSGMAAATTGTPPPTSAPALSVGFPTPIRHVFVIVMENKPVSAIYGPMPYETSLAKTYAWGGIGAPNHPGYYALCHPSAPNYLGLTSGQTLQCGSDAHHVYGVSNIGESLQRAGLSWIAYEESAQVPCQATSSGLYHQEHNPFSYYSDLGGSRAGSVCETHVVPIASLVQDYPYAKTPPAFTFIIPNILDDGHSSSAAYGDQWLSTFVPKLISAGWFSSSVIFVVYDEATGTGSSAGYAGLTGGPVYMVAISPYTLGVGAYSADASHYDLLSTVEWLLGLPGTGTGHDSTTSFPAMEAMFKP